MKNIWEESTETKWWMVPSNISYHNWEVADDITHQELSFLLGTPRDISSRILMYFEHQYFPCLLADCDGTLVIWFLCTLTMKIQVA